MRVSMSQPPLRFLGPSIRIHKAAVTFLINGNPRCSLFSALLSILVARDSTIIAIRGVNETVSSILGEVNTKIGEVKDLLDQLEGEDVDVTVARRILNLA